jgi:glycine/D-amino acid oxidase-like deaminating enzyme/nitrite reductase/ring-hydroxylating ferredoxin subunit
MASRTRVRSAPPKNEPVWWPGVKLPEFPALEKDVRVDVAVVGAGISGLTTAYLLAREGKSVAVVDDGGLGTGMTGATTAHLTNCLDRRYTDIARVRGEEAARLAAESHASAIDRIGRIAREEKIDCDFERVDGYLFAAAGAAPSTLDAELDAVRAAGIPAEWVERAPLPSFDTGKCIRFPRQARFHPLHYIAGLARAVGKRGGRIFSNTHVDEIRGGDEASIRAGKLRIACDAIVVATNVPVNDLVAIHTKQAAFMSYVIGARLPEGLVPAGLYWDSEDPFHYVRTAAMPDGDGDCLIVGGEDHRTGQASDTGDRHRRLEDWARARFPEIQEVAFTWAGQVMETLDGLAFIGRNPMDADNVYVATGDSGNGLTHGTIAGILLTDQILGRDNAWTELYEPSRKPVRAAGTFVREAANTVAQYAGWFTGGDAAKVSDIPRDSGAVIRRGAEKIAVYKGPRGAVLALSAVCPHLGCLVAWNDAEKTWDCPCHGSRFDKVGRVVNGPANRDLEEVERPKD